MIFYPPFWFNNNHNIGHVLAIAAITYKNVISKTIYRQTNQ